MIALFAYPHGYEKSLVYDILPFVKGLSHCSVVIVVTPLNVNVNEVVSRHGDLVMKVCSECTIAGTEKITSDFKRVAFATLLAIRKCYWKSMLST